LVAAAIVTTALALAAAHAPARIRLIGLFSLAFGVVIGWLVPKLSGWLNCQPSRLQVGFVATALTLIGLVGSMLETSRLETARKPKSDKDALAERLIEHLRNESNANNPGLAPESTSSSSPTSITVFRKYLAHRLKQLGDWSSPWPELFWGFELLAATVASVWVSMKFTPP
jgi:MFS family permease